MAKSNKRGTIIGGRIVILDDTTYNLKYDVPLELESIDRLEYLLDFLNKNPNRYIGRSEIEKKLGKKFDANVLVYALGINDKLPPPNSRGIPDQNAPHTASYLADIAQIRQTKFIDMRPVSKGNSKEDGYMITPRGIELLNQRLSTKYSKEILDSSDRLERLTYILAVITTLLAVFALLQILITPPNIPISVIEARLGLATATIVVIIVIVIGLYYLIKRIQNN